MNDIPIRRILVTRDRFGGELSISTTPATAQVTGSDYRLGKWTVVLDQQQASLVGQALLDWAGVQPPPRLYPDVDSATVGA